MQSSTKSDAHLQLFLNLCRTQSCQIGARLTLHSSGGYMPNPCNEEDGDGDKSSVATRHHDGRVLVH